MMCDEQFSYLKNILEYAATRMPKSILHRAEEIFPSLNCISNCMDSVKDEPDSDSDMCQDRNQVISVKAEDVSDIKIEEHPIPITNQVMKDEQEDARIPITS
ncbi:uncharacterized protein LOC110831296 [Zootermopsis nevadensis]|uniref:uncharacterized protein LOC110831296 n=1 Tax=Zootermopsis nevadensis TaxID=136037 RepID=UPI000B8E2D88|nr:uncharacterized protein LOC110831296 [Zootermopsis nevadensis]